MIYFIECAGRIKIGFSVDPKIRLNKIAADAPYPCKMLGIIIGDREIEKEIHARWNHLHCHREWFAASKELLTWISENCSSPDAVIYGKSHRAISQFEIRHGLKRIIAKECGVTCGAVSQWHKIPAEYCATISRVTGIAVSDLRPDLFEEAA